MAEKQKLRIGRLHTLGEVAAELGRLYKEARRGGLDRMLGRGDHHPSPTTPSL
jgi:hypothetical protein